MEQKKLQKTLFVSEGLLIEAQHVDGKLIRTVGRKVQAESAEMNQVKVRQGENTFFFQLGENVRWLEAEL